MKRNNHAPLPPDGCLILAAWFAVGLVFVAASVAVVVRLAWRR
jgi:hypothetical protein